MILKFGLKVIPYTYTLFILNKFHSKMALLCEGTKKIQQKGFSTYAELAFFSRTSQGHNALPRPGLEPESSDSEPSALTTGLLDKAVVLACPRYS